MGNPTRNIHVAAVQFEHAAGDKLANLEKVRRFTAAAAEKGADLVAFPECCLTGYWHLRKLSRAELADLAEPVFDGPSCRVLRALAAEHGIIVAAGLVEIDSDGHLYNTYVVALPDGACRRHRKIHCFISEHMSCGSRITAFDTPLSWRVGVLTCYDNNLIENVRLTALAGVDLLLAPHQTGGCNSPDPHGMKPIDRAVWDNRHNDPDAIRREFLGDKGRGWLMRWLPARAHDNGLFLLFANGVGVDDDEIRTGGAMVLDTYGRVLAETYRPGDDTVIAELDAELLARCTGRRWMRTRRPELYGPLCVPTGMEVSTRQSRLGQDREGK